MKLIEEMMNKKAELEIAPLIDVVFLLLIYFMVTASLVKKEADLSFMLPVDVPLENPLDKPFSIMIEISDIGDILIEGMLFGKGEGNVDKLIGSLMSFKQSADSQGSAFVVEIVPDDKALHGWIVPVMDACAAANAKNVSFSMAQ